MRKVNANRLLWLTVVGLTVVLITSVIGVSDQRAVNAARRVEPTDARSNSSGEPPGTFGSPSILWTKPADGEWNVSLGQPIIIRFNESMTFLVMFDLVPDASPYFVTWTEADTNFSINHRLFSICTLYTASVRWDDGFGNWLSYSWRFLTLCLPFIRHTLPFNGSVDVGLEQEIRVEFNEPMENTSLVFTIDPPAGILSYAWLSGDTTVIINHSALFADATLYTAEVVSATNRSGGALQPG